MEKIERYSQLLKQYYNFVLNNCKDVDEVSKVFYEIQSYGNMNAILFNYQIYKDVMYLNRDNFGCVNIRWPHKHNKVISNELNEIIHRYYFVIDITFLEYNGCKHYDGNELFPMLNKLKDVINNKYDSIKSKFESQLKDLDKFKSKLVLISFNDKNYELMINDNFNELKIDIMNMFEIPLDDTILMLSSEKVIYGDPDVKMLKNNDTIVVELVSML